MCLLAVYPTRATPFKLTYKISADTLTIRFSNGDTIQCARANAASLSIIGKWQKTDIYTHEVVEEWDFRIDKSGDLRVPASNPSDRPGGFNWETLELGMLRISPFKGDPYNIYYETTAESLTLFFVEKPQQTYIRAR